MLSSLNAKRRASFQVSESHREIFRQEKRRSDLLPSHIKLNYQKVGGLSVLDKIYALQVDASRADMWL